MAQSDRPREFVIRQLYALSMNRCAFPECPTPLVTPETGTVVGEVCHIKAKSTGGPRYSTNQNDEERHGFNNLILMCRNHHKEIDTLSNLDIYTVEWLHNAKTNHEDRARASGPINAPTDVVTALTLSTVSYEAGSTHMDFRDAVFKVGGAGGGPLGGGGQGGVLTIVGISRLPREVEDQVHIDLAGGNGTAPGGGGGGGGVFVFEGRCADDGDVAAGLSVPLFFPANSATVADGLLYVLGAGWDFFWVPSFPCETVINVAFTVEFGSIGADALFNFRFAMITPEGSLQALATHNVEVPSTSGLINATAQSAAIPLTFHGPGIHAISIRSGNIEFRSYKFEVRLRRETD